MTLDALLEQLADAIAERVTARLNGNGAAGKEPPSVPETLLTAQEAAARLHVAPRWLYRHAARLPFTVRLAPRVVRFREAGLRTWLERQR